MTADRETQRDVEAALAARRELGPEYDEHVAAGLAERMDALVAMRLAETRGELSDRQLEREDQQSSRSHRFVLGIVSVGAGIPVTGIVAGTHGGLIELAVAWAGIVGVNVAAAWRRR